MSYTSFDFPHTHFYDDDLRELIKKVFDMDVEVKNFVSVNAIKYANPIQWNITSQYEKNTIVIDPLTGTAYISVAAVPSGVALTREEFWTVVFDLGQFVVRASKNFSERYEQETTLTATFATSEGQWLVWGDTLYVANVNITPGDSYVVGGNIRHITVEEMYNAVLSIIDNEVQARQDADTALQGAINNETQTRQNADTALQGAIDNEAQARQDADTALQGAIDNEAQARQIAINNEAQARENADNNILEIIGDLDDLETTDKSNIVNAINDVISSGSVLSTTLLYPDMFTGSDSDKLQACMDALQSTGGTIVINRNMELTSDVVIGLPSDDVADYITVIGIGKNSTITMNGAKFIGAEDAAIRHCGQVKFINVKFEGADNTSDIFIVTDYILRCGFIHCTFSNFLNVFVSTSREMQSYIVDDCVFLKPIARAFKIEGTARWFDVRINNCRAEQLTEFIDFDTSNFHVCCAYGVNVSNCCIESCETRYAIRLQNFNNFAITNCYFEDNLISIKLDEAGDGVGLLIDGNFFSEPLTAGHAAILLPSSVAGIWGAITNNSFYNAGAATYFLDGNVTGAIKVDTHNNNGYSYSSTNIVQHISNPNITRLITPTSVTVSSPNTPTLVGNVRTLVDELGDKTVVGISLGAVSAPTGGFSGYLTLYGDNLYAVFTTAQTYTFRFVIDCI